jgi:predicted PurR-regulated permease PerM
VWAWSFVGFVVASIIVFVALAAVSEIVLPLTFAAVLAIIFKPVVRILERHKVWPALAAGIVVLGLLAVVAGVIIATVRGVTQQADQISGVADKAVGKAADLTDAVGVDQSSLDALRKAIDDAAPMITTGVLSGLVSGFGTVVAVVSGVILGALIMYYLLKDGTRLRRAVVGLVDPEFRSDLDDFIGDSCRVLRDYGRGRTVMSAIVAVAIGLVALLLGLPLVFTIIVVNFIGGYIPTSAPS